MSSGVYTITSPSGGQYVGSTCNFASRRSAHKKALQKGRHNRRLQAAYKKYGGDALVFRPLLICAKRDLLFFEQRAIDILKPRYNAKPTAAGGPARGHPVSAETRRKLAAQAGWKHTDEARAKMRRQFSPEHRAKLAAAHRGRISPLRGIPRPPEVRAKLSAALKGRPRGAR